MSGIKVRLNSVEPIIKAYRVRPDNIQSADMEQYIIHSSASRGRARHGWLDSHHTFSFAGYYDPNRMNFGMLRVLNDDVVEAGQGFGTHPHDNMEIISIPLEGVLEHRDSMGNVATISEGDIQVMSAGTGIRHSEYNKSKTAKVRFLQIWVIPNQRNVVPRYDQITLNKAQLHNNLQLIVAPGATEGAAWIHQDAWFSMGVFDRGHTASYSWHQPSNGLYIFVISGRLKVGTHTLEARDGMGITGLEQIELTAETADARVLLMEVPMEMK